MYIKLHTTANYQSVRLQTIIHHWVYNKNKLETCGNFLFQLFQKANVIGTISRLKEQHFFLGLFHTRKFLSTVAFESQLSKVILENFPVWMVHFQKFITFQSHFRKMEHVPCFILRKWLSKAITGNFSFESWLSKETFQCERDLCKSSCERMCPGHWLLCISFSNLILKAEWHENSIQPCATYSQRFSSATSEGRQEAQLTQRDINHMLVEILSTAAQLYEKKSHLERLAVGELAYHR